MEIITGTPSKENWYICQHLLSHSGKIAVCHVKPLLTIQKGLLFISSHLTSSTHPAPLLLSQLFSLSLLQLTVTHLYILLFIVCVHRWSRGTLGESDKNTNQIDNISDCLKWISAFKWCWTVLPSSKCKDKNIHPQLPPPHTHTDKEILFVLPSDFFNILSNHMLCYW